MNQRFKEIAHQVGIVPLNDPTIFGFKEEDVSYYCKGRMIDELILSVVDECVETILNNTDRHRKEYFANLLREHWNAN